MKREHDFDSGHSPWHGSPRSHRPPPPGSPHNALCSINIAYAASMHAFRFGIVRPTKAGGRTNEWMNGGTSDRSVGRSVGWSVRPVGPQSSVRPVPRNYSFPSSSYSPPRNSDTSIQRAGLIVQYICVFVHKCNSSCSTYAINKSQIVQGATSVSDVPEFLYTKLEFETTNRVIF